MQSYSQSGEDIIVSRALNKMGIRNPLYLDIGANDPVKLNNTFLLYKKGGSGVLIEPDPILCSKIKQKRRRDAVLNVGVSGQGCGEADFFILDNNYLNTFSRAEAERIQEYGKHKVLEKRRIKLIDVNTIISENFDECPHFISLDVEGLDFEIISSLDFNQHRPAALCVETITYTEDNSEYKRMEIINFLKEKGYLHFADTYINSIFVDFVRWKHRGQSHK